jgi:hypothetical protein
MPADARCIDGHALLSAQSGGENEAVAQTASEGESLPAAQGRQVLNKSVGRSAGITCSPSSRATGPPELDGPVPHYGSLSSGPKAAVLSSRHRNRAGDGSMPPAYSPKKSPGMLWWEAGPTCAGPQPICSALCSIRRRGTKRLLRPPRKGEFCRLLKADRCSRMLLASRSTRSAGRRGWRRTRVSLADL